MQARSVHGAEVAPAVLMALAAVASLVAALVWRAQIAISNNAAKMAGYPVLYAGMGLFVWALAHIRGAVRGLVAPRAEAPVVTGPFRFIRHPIYLALTMALLGAALVTRSFAGGALCLLAFLPAAIRRARLEERALEERFGEAWHRHAAATGFFFPRLPRRHRA